MSGPIQVWPRGLLGFFQLKNNGRYPDQMPETLLPTFDLSSWYLNTNAVDFTCTRTGIVTGDDGQVSWSAANIDGGSFTSVTVPNDEWWALLEYTCYCVLGAGDTISLAPSVKNAPLSQFLALGTQTPESTGANRQVTSLLNYAPRFLAPGSELTATIGNVTAAVSVAVLGAGRFARLPV